jgi:hypothetical protein
VEPVKQHRLAHGQLNSVGYERSNRKAASPVGTDDRRGVAWGGRCWSYQPVYNSSGSYIGQAYVNACS